jgi:hypothetical protein
MLKTLAALVDVNKRPYAGPTSRATRITSHDHKCAVFGWYVPGTVLNPIARRFQPLMATIAR